MNHFGSIEELENRILEAALFKNNDQRKRSHSTEISYHYDLSILKEFLGSKGLTYPDLDRGLVKEYKMFLQTKKHPVKKKGESETTYETYSKATRLRNLRNLRNFYRWGVILNFFSENPFDYIEFPKQDIGYIQNEDLYSIDQLKMLFQTAKNRSLRDYCIVLLLVTSRMLPREIISLKWCKIGLDQNNNYICTVVGRSGLDRDVLINEYTFEQMMKYRIEQKLSPDTCHTDEGFVFVSRKKQPLALSTIRYIIEEICIEANIPVKSPMVLVHNNVLLGRYFGCSAEDLIDQAGFKIPTVINKYLTRTTVNGIANKIDIRGFVGENKDEK